MLKSVPTFGSWETIDWQTYRYIDWNFKLITLLFSRRKFKKDIDIVMGRIFDWKVFIIFKRKIFKRQNYNQKYVQIFTNYCESLFEHNKYIRIFFNAREVHHVLSIVVLFPKNLKPICLADVFSEFNIESHKILKRAM